VGATFSTISRTPLKVLLLPMIFPKSSMTAPKKYLYNSFQGIYKLFPEVSMPLNVSVEGIKKSPNGGLTARLKT
jgi:hypothetical protein